jgi:phage gp36-like protein
VSSLYCTQDDIEKLIPLSILATLANDEAGATDVDDEILAENIDIADREIDSYCGAVVTVPFTTVPPLIANFSAIMTVWILHRRKYLKSEQWETAYNNCIKQLMLINQGRLSLLSSAGAELTTSSVHVASSRTQKFTSDVWDTF